MPKHIKTMQELFDLLSGKEDKPKKEPCPSCGLSVKEFNETNKFGCPTCYDHFKDALLGCVKNFQDDDKHIGKKPQNEEVTAEKVKLLKLQLVRAKEFEDYRKAAQIQAELNEIARRTKKEG